MAAKETKEVVLGLVAGVKAFFDIKADGKVSIDDMQHVMKAYPYLKEGAEGISLVLGELKSITPAEVESLLVEGLAALAVSDEKLQAKILEGAKTLLQGWKFLQALKA